MCEKELKRASGIQYIPYIFTFHLQWPECDDDEVTYLSPLLYLMFSSFTRGVSFIHNVNQALQ